MKKRSFRRNILLLLACFILSRLIVKLLGVSFMYSAIFDYWQYLDVESLQNNLLQSLWYQHSQPPVFNFLLGIVLKCSESNAPLVFELLFLLISFSNAYLIYHIIDKLTGKKYLPLVLSLFYILSPATILYENELFYTSFTSLLLLLLVAFIIKFTNSPSKGAASGLFGVLTLLCLTRTTYHLILLMLICGILLLRSYKKRGFKLVFIGSLFSIFFVGGWYTKNYVVFDKFSASSWLGINFARIVFHDVGISDTGTIASVHPGLPISYYKKYISGDYLVKYAGLNDRILLQEFKTGSLVNMNHAGYLQVSDEYMEACKDHVSRYPGTYLAHALTSIVIFFSPASSYFKVQENNNKIRYYDLLYSFNLSHLVKDEENKRVALAVAAFPKCVIYAMVFFIIISSAIRLRFISVVNSIITITLLFILMISTIFEYGENMRFRYELEPLFLILASQAIITVKTKRSVAVYKLMHEPGKNG